MLDFIKDNITEPLQQMIIDSINSYIMTVLGTLVDFLSNVIYQEMELIKGVFDHPYFISATHWAQGLAITLLAVRIAYQAFQQYILYSTGQESSPGHLLRESGVAVAIIATAPWIVQQVYLFSVSMVDDLLQITPVTAIDNLTQAIMSIMTTGASTVSIIAALLLIGFVMILIVLLQIAARTVMIGLLQILGPFMYAMKNDLGQVWFKAVLTNCLAMPIQMFLLRGALGMLVNTYTAQHVFMSVLLFIGFLWTTIKAPQFIQQFSAQTGIGSAVGGAAQTTGQYVIMRKILTRGA